MAYTVCDSLGQPTPVRFVMERGNGLPLKVGDPVKQEWWVCDPCNGSDKRYEVTFRPGYQPQYYRWYEIVLSDDSDDDIGLKVSHYQRVIDARKAVAEAERELKRLM